MKKIILFFLFAVIVSESKTDTSFEYGFLIKHTSEPDLILSVQDTLLAYGNDQLRINASTSGGHFYIIYIDSSNEYYMLYSKNFPYAKNRNSINWPESWATLDNSKGWETFYIINSEKPQEELSRYFNYYEKASKDKVKQRLVGSIQDILDGFYPKSRDLASFSSTLEKPIVGGVSLRGDDDLLTQFHLTHNCKSNDGVAVKRIVLDKTNSIKNK